MKAIDVASDTSGHAHAMLDAGIEAVGLYLRADRASQAMVRGLAMVGIKRFSVWEQGYPTTGTYFTAHQGELDAGRAVAFAQHLGQPSGSQIFFAVDFDAENLGPIAEYFAAAQRIVKTAGYLCSVYGSGTVCAYLIRKGLAHSGWLAQSKGWAGYEDFKPHAAIVQGPETTLLGFDVDTDTVIDEAVCW